MAAQMRYAGVALEEAARRLGGGQPPGEAAGGALGSLARWGLAAVLPHAGSGWPWSTLIVNVTGSLLLGVLLCRTVTA